MKKADENKIVSRMFTIRGITPLIVENFHKPAERAVDALFLGSKYLDDEGVDCFPCGAIRAAIIDAARFIDPEKVSTLRQGIFVEDPADPTRDLLPLGFSRCAVFSRHAGHENAAHNASYHDWTLSFRTHAVQLILSSEQLLELIAQAGRGGLGGWRPASKKGTGGPYGRFEIASVE